MKILLIIVSILYGMYGFSQQISGTVMDGGGKRLSSVTVSVKGGMLKTLTDKDGRFRLKTDPNGTLVFTGIGFEMKEENIDKRSTMNVYLTEKNNTLDEIQVIGYGTNTQRMNLGSVTKIRAEDIEKQPVSNPLSLLQGRVPGLVVSSTSGIPGSSFKVQLRGQNTINTNFGAAVPMDNPLFIIDGVPFGPQNENINSFGSMAAPGTGRMFNNSYGGVSPFNTLNPNDIESIEVLRDADATAIYGARAGNGVILITTKKGKAGKTELTLSSNMGIASLGETMPMMNTEQFLEMRKEAYKNDNRVPSADPVSSTYAPDLMLFDSGRDIDWIREFFRKPSFSSTINAGLSGGNSDTQFRFGTNYHNSTFMMPGNFSDRKIGLSLGIHHRTKDQKLNFDFSGSYNHGKNNSSLSPNLLLTANLQPNYPEPVNEARELVWYHNGAALNGVGAPVNPYAYLLQKYQIASNTINSNMVVSYTPVKNLILKTNFGISDMSTDEYSATPKKSRFPGFDPLAEASFGAGRFTSWLMEPQLNYMFNLNSLQVTTLLGGTFQNSSQVGRQVFASGYLSDELIGSISGAPVKNAQDQSSIYRYAAIFGRVNLNLSKKYLLSINFRRDGSSKFGPQRQFGNFGSIAAGWLFSEEEAVKKLVPVLSYGKLRMSYGITGSDATGNYNYLSRWRPTDYRYGNSLGYVPVNLSNSLFSWASTKKMEVGAEFGFMKDRLLFTLAWYRNRTGNQLVNYTLPMMTGFSSVVENWDAIVENAGFEIVAQASLIKGKNFAWSASLNITVPKNKLISFPGLEESAYATTYTIGRSLSSLYLFRYAGVDHETGLFSFYKNDGTTSSTPQDAKNGNFNDLSYFGNTDPRFFGGLSNTFRYGRLQLDILAEFRKQLGKNYLGQVYNYRPGGNANMPAELLNRWQKPGDIAQFQKFSTYSSSPAGRATRPFIDSDAVYGDASFIRLKSISLSYGLPVAVLRRIGTEQLQIFCSMQNLFTITNYKGNDPETQSFYGVPPLKTYTLGFQAKF